VQFYLIAMSSGAFPDDTFLGLGEAISPIEALLNARQSQMHNILNLADRKLGLVNFLTDGKGEPPIHRLQTVYITEPIVPLPLGWRLLKAGDFQIDRQMGQISHCQPGDGFEQKSKIWAFTSANCVQLLFYHQLRGDDLGSALRAAQHRIR
jgi:hypothetical protein